MKNYYAVNLKTTSSMYDNNLLLKFDEILAILQDLATAHSYDMGIDHNTLLANSNAFWVLSRVKFKINENIENNSKVYLKTWPLKPTGVRFLRNFFFKQNSKTMVEAKSEWCVLDALNFSVRKLDSISYPKDMKYIEKTIGSFDFSKEKYSILDSDFCYDYKVVLTDIDCNNHTNNVAYARMALNAFGLNEFKNYNFSTFEIKFINQSFYGNTIKIYKKQINSTTVYVEGWFEDKKIFYTIFSN